MQMYESLAFLLHMLSLPDYMRVSRHSCANILVPNFICVFFSLRGELLLPINPLGENGSKRFSATETLHLYFQGVRLQAPLNVMNSELERDNHC